VAQRRDAAAPRGGARLLPLPARLQRRAAVHGQRRHSAAPPLLPLLLRTALPRVVVARSELCNRRAARAARAARRQRRGCAPHAARCAARRDKARRGVRMQQHRGVTRGKRRTRVRNE
jgi:hypothetical protein